MAQLTAAHLAGHDALNEEIWHRSPAVQSEIQPSRRRWNVGEVGAQQAMCGAEALPWVPDLVGAQFGQPGSVLVMGMAYSGFVRRPTHSRGELDPAAYARCSSAADFCATFARRVVPAYHYYGNLLDALPAETGPRRVAFTDLCRVALVKVGTRGDSSRGVERADRAMFCRYADEPANLDWHRRRLRAAQPAVVVALGHVAEHGLLRLLRDDLGCDIATTGPRPVAFSRKSGATTWPTAYAADQRQIGTWEHTRDWWRAEGKFGRWNVVTIPHTSETPVAPVHAERIRRAWFDLGGADG